MRLIFARMHNNSEANGTVHEVHKQLSGRPCAETSPAYSVMALVQFTRSSQMSANNVHYGNVMVHTTTETL
jgi:hypothetical protein